MKVIFFFLVIRYCILITCLSPFVLVLMRKHMLITHRNVKVIKFDILWFKVKIMVKCVPFITTRTTLILTRNLIIIDRVSEKNEIK